MTLYQVETKKSECHITMSAVPEVFGLIDSTTAF